MKKLLKNKICESCKHIQDLQTDKKGPKSKNYTATVYKQ